jgi:hypothetical protein
MLSTITSGLEQADAMLDPILDDISKLRSKMETCLTNRAESDKNYNSRAAKDGNAIERAIADKINNVPEFRKHTSAVIGHEITHAECIGTKQNATDIVMYTLSPSKPKLLLQLKSSIGDRFSGQMHRFSNTPLGEESSWERIKDHCLTEKTDIEPLSNEEIRSITHKMCDGENTEFVPDYMVLVFSRGLENQQLYICNMETLKSYFLSNMRQASERMSDGRKHRTVHLAPGLTLQRRGGEGTKEDGTTRDG